MRHLLLLIVFSLCYQYSLCTQVWQYRKSRDGFTMVATGGYEDSVGNHKMYDALFKVLVHKTKSDRHGIKVLVILDQSVIHTSYYKWFATIAYDTLREVDREFIEAYSYYRRKGYKNIIRSNLPSERFKIDLPEPIDLNSTFQTGHADLGLKIIYESGLNDSISFFDRIYTLTKYGLKNINEIKKKQSRVVVPYSSDQIKVSVLTIDTSKIQSIPLISLGFNQEGKDFNSSFNIIIYFGVAFLITLSFYVARHFWFKNRDLNKDQ